VADYRVNEFLISRFNPTCIVRHANSPSGREKPGRFFSGLILPTSVF
jgi:hypothetical protein